MSADSPATHRSFRPLAGVEALLRRLQLPPAPGGAERRRFWDDLFDGRVTEFALVGHFGEAASHLRRLNHRRGRVALVGAGPGDPELLTLRAQRLLGEAEVVIYDRLVGPGILDLARPGALRIYAGKRRGDHVLPQDEVNRLLVAHARAGRRVVRLKGGDPFLFGRGGEEIATLRREGVAFEIVPGISAANGCAAYAGIPLTHRDHAHTCVMVTGHTVDGRLDLDWRSLARPRQTVVVYMGLRSLPVLSRALIAHGLPPETPAAVVENGTMARQRVVTATLEALPAAAAAGVPIEGPALVIVGSVVALRDRLAWFGGDRAPPAAPGSSPATDRHQEV